MQVSLEWINEFVDISDLTAEEIAHELTMSGLEVEEIEKTGNDFSDIYAAEIIEVKSHPNADKLHLVEIFNGKEKREVVCGAQNIEKGQIVPYASVGSEVKDRKTGEKFALKPVKIRGIESQGMLCSAEELGLKTEDFQKDDGILILNRFVKDVKAGDDIKKVLDISEDAILHVAPTANRGDEMSVIGIAREISAIFNRKFNYSEVQYLKEMEKADFEVDIIDDETCRYYSVGILKNIKIKPSPHWLKRRLTASGVRSISNIVDITNYVMLEYGQPLHAFDLDKLEENYLCVRRAFKDEKLVTLDDVERDLTADSVLIAAKSKTGKLSEPVALAGIMGGQSTEVDDNTKNIALESAYFTPVYNRRSSRSVGLRTEACARFERGVDIQAVKPALIRAMQLMSELADAQIGGIAQCGDNELPEINITLRYNQIKRILGIDILPVKCNEICEKLGFELLGKNDFSAKFRVPSYRINDVTREIDLIEEIGRIHGYDKIEPSLPRKTQSVDVSSEIGIIEQINQILLGQGFYEAVTSSLVGKGLVNLAGLEINEDTAVKVSNPQSEEHTHLRQSTIPSMLNIVKHNFDNGQKNLQLYEMAKIFIKTDEADAKTSGVTEKRMISGAVTGSVCKGLLSDKAKSDFYELKGVIESLITAFGLENRVEYKPVKDIPSFHPGRAAEILLLGKSSLRLGVFGEIHPEISEKCKFNQSVYIFEVELEELLKNVSSAVPKFKQLPQYPAVSRDIAFLINKGADYQGIYKTLKKISSNLVKNIEIFDVYEGKNLPEGMKNLAFRLTLQDYEATLTDERVDSEIKTVKESLKKVYAEINYRE